MISRFTSVLCVLLLLLFGSVVAGYSQAVSPPTLTRTGALTVRVSGGSVLSAGEVIPITATTLTMAASKPDCGIDNDSVLASCNILYAASGTPAVTSTVATAFAVGSSYANVVLGYVTTSSTEITAIFPAVTTNPVAISSMTLTDCTTGNCTTGQTRTYGGAVQMIEFSGPATAGKVTTTNMPFTSSTSYKCYASPVSNADTTNRGAVQVTALSGSSAEFRLSGDAAGVGGISGFCIGR